MTIFFRQKFLFAAESLRIISLRSLIVCCFCTEIFVLKLVGVWIRTGLWRFRLGRRIFGLEYHFKKSDWIRSKKYHSPLISAAQIYSVTSVRSLTIFLQKIHLTKKALIQSSEARKDICFIVLTLHPGHVKGFNWSVT